jgi:hypothetical protein
MEERASFECDKWGMPVYDGRWDEQEGPHHRAKPGDRQIAAFFFIFVNQSHDAQWQLDYFPLWVADLPISLTYFALKLPFPLAEAIIGPLWWFCLPVIIGRLFRPRRHQS